MTAPSITLQATAPGKAASRDVFALGSRTVLVAVYKYTWGTDNYTTGGEDISDIWDDFKEVLAIVPSQVDATINDRRDFSVDLTNKLLIMYTAFNTEASAGNQSAVADVRLVVYGHI